MENQKTQNQPKLSPKEKTAELILESLATDNCPLYADHPYGMARNTNPTTNVVYSGVNDLLLDMRLNMNGNPNNEIMQGNWLTMEQTNQLGGRILKGEKSQQVLFFHKGADDYDIKQLLETLDKLGEPHPSQEEIAELQKNYYKTYYVFNESQIDFKGKDMQFAIVQTPMPDKEKRDYYELKFSEAAKQFKVESNPREVEILKEQIAKYIVGKKHNTGYEIDDTSKTILQEAVKNGSLDREAVMFALKEGAEWSQQASPYNTSNTLAELQILQAQKAFDFIKENMKEKGQGYYNKEVWKELFEIEKQTKQAIKLGKDSSDSTRLDKFLETIKNYEPKPKQQNLSARERLNAMPQHSAEKKAAAVAFLRENRIDSSKKNVAESANRENVKSENVEKTPYQNTQSQNERRSFRI